MPGKGSVLDVRGFQILEYLHRLLVEHPSSKNPNSKTFWISCSCSELLCSLCTPAADPSVIPGTASSEPLNCLSRWQICSLHWWEERGRGRGQGRCSWLGFGPEYSICSLSPNDSVFGLLLHTRFRRHWIFSSWAFWHCDLTRLPWLTPTTQVGEIDQWEIQVRTEWVFGFAFHFRKLGWFCSLFLWAYVLCCNSGRFGGNQK